MKVKSCIILFSFILIGLYAQEAKSISDSRMTTAVLDFEGLGITTMESIALTQRLAGEMVSTKAFILVDRSQMEEILQEQGFQQSGCSSAECAVEIGNLLGVQQMVSGSFGKIGETYTIETKLFSVETSETIRAVNKTYKGAVDGLITQVELVAWDLAGLEPPDALKKKAGIKTEEPKVVKKSGGKKWLLWGGLLTLAGAGAAYAISQQDEGEVLEDLGEPPGPPSLPRLFFGGGR